jgi:hypothetical protein
MTDHSHDAGKEKAVTAPQLNTYKFDVIAVTTVDVRAETEDQARAMIDGLNSITTRTTSDDIEAGYGLDVSTRDFDVLNVSPRGRGYIVSAETPDGQEISVSALEIIPDPILSADLAGLREELAGADRALAGDSNDAEADALYGLAEAARVLLDGSGYSRTGKSGPTAHPGPDFPHAPTASTPADPARTASSGTPTPPAARTASPASRDEAERVKAPAGRASAPRLADSSFPDPLQTGRPPAAPPGSGPSRASDRTRGRRR